MSKFNFEEFNKIKTKIAKKGTVETKYGEITIKEIQGRLIIDIADEKLSESQKIFNVLSQCIIVPKMSEADLNALLDNDTETAVDIFMAIINLSDKNDDVEVIKKN
jgi:hypothetical protein